MGINDKISDRSYHFDPDIPAPIVAVRNKLLAAEASERSEETQISSILKAKLLFMKIV